jgi:phasin family protein
MQYWGCHILLKHAGEAHKEKNVMAKAKTRAAKRLGGKRSSRSDRTKVAGAVQEFAHQGIAFAKDVSEKAKAAEETSKVFKQRFSKGAAEFNIQWIEVVHANINSNFNFARQLISVKSASELLELSSEHARKQFETFAKQTQYLMGLAQKAATDAAEPFQTGMKSVLTRAA